MHVWHGIEHGADEQSDEPKSRSASFGVVIIYLRDSVIRSVRRTYCDDFGVSISLSVSINARMIRFPPNTMHDSTSNVKDDEQSGEPK